MATAFSRSLRSLQADSFRRSAWGMVVVAGLLGAAGGWFFLAHIELYETAQTARLEVDREVHPVTALVAGRVTKTTLALALQVQAGQVLVELDAEAERLRLNEEQTLATAKSARLNALRKEMTAEETAWVQEQKTALLMIEEARARHGEAVTAARFADDEAKRIAQLDENKLVAKSDALRAASEAQQKQAAADALKTAISRLESEAQSKEKNHQARLAKLESEAALLEGEMQTIAATVKRCEYDIDKRLIRAPVTGRIGEVASLRVGAFVAEGEQVAAVIPSGQLKAVAHFPPASALGRIRAGQPAWLRLDGFPWTQYGRLAGQVASVANEPREGSIRVDLTVDPRSAPLIPVQHGLPGTVEVRVDRVTPATLVLRAVGKLLSAPGPTLGFHRE